jgi:hypothetical protein
MLRSEPWKATMEKSNNHSWLSERISIHVGFINYFLMESIRPCDEGFSDLPNSIVMTSPAHCCYPQPGTRKC